MRKVSELLCLENQLSDWNSMMELIKNDNTVIENAIIELKFPSHSFQVSSLLKD